ncbi:hypothetical protein EV127DRAFT_407626 [Xylaria flabelliformis]|nr:hypothetical protein EV127DRAFT_407626 [Xylaria flabelliformis]
MARELLNSRMPIYKHQPQLLVVSEKLRSNVDFGICSSCIQNTKKNLQSEMDESTPEPEEGSVHEQVVRRSDPSASGSPTRPLPFMLVSRHLWLVSVIVAPLLISKLVSNTRNGPLSNDNVGSHEVFVLFVGSPLLPISLLRLSGRLLYGVTYKTHHRPSHSLDHRPTTLHLHTGRSRSCSSESLQGSQDSHLQRASKAQLIPPPIVETSQLAGRVTTVLAADSSAPCSSCIRLQIPRCPFTSIHIVYCRLSPQPGVAGRDRLSSIHYRQLPHPNFPYLIHYPLRRLSNHVRHSLLPVKDNKTPRRRRSWMAPANSPTLLQSGPVSRCFALLTVTQASPDRSPLDKVPILDCVPGPPPTYRIRSLLHHSHFDVQFRTSQPETRSP